VSRSLLPAILPLFSRRLQLPISGAVDRPLTLCEHVIWRDVANRAAEENIVAMLNVALHQTPRILQR
jgi:hypothetical protein